MIPILPVNRNPIVRDHFTPVKTKTGGWVWIEYDDDKEHAHEEFLGLVPPKKNMYPYKTFGSWFWVTKQEVTGGKHRPKQKS